MAYNQLANTVPIVLNDRVLAIENSLFSTQAANLYGVHFYSGCGFVPATLTTGTSTAGVATTIFVNELVIPANIPITGIAILLGTVGGTNSIIVTLYDTNGNVLATSALAGTLAGTASTFQRIPFITQYLAGPGRYFIGVQINGTTATISTQAAGNHYAGTITAQTFGTPVAITPPSSFTAGTGPIAMSY
jgi:hypothetical protein